MDTLNNLVRKRHITKEKNTTTVEPRSYITTMILVKQLRNRKYAQFSKLSREQARYKYPFGPAVSKNRKIEDKGVPPAQHYSCSQETKDEGEKD